MNLPVYTATGNYSNPNILNLDICIPAEDPNNPYVFDTYDMSKSDSNNQQINVVFSHVMKCTDGSSEWTATRYDFHLDIDIPISKNFPGGNNFDPNNQDAMYVLFHNNLEVTEIELQWVYDNIETLYDKVKTGNFTMYLPDVSNSERMFFPKRIGLSLIAKN